jgi:ABC-type nitrate/sulfonate/bicarbonate transport system substrate-binding protein
MNHKCNLLCMGLFILSLSACQSGEVGPPPSEEIQEVIMMLDWVPNTNHTGIFVAQDQGYFHEAGLEVTIIEPGEVYAEQAVSGGAADFGISFQEQLTIARANGVPLVSIAAILQHNTSGFASRGDLDLASPREWESSRYGAFGSPFEEPTLRVLMECDGGDFDQLEVVDTGFADPLALLSENQIDLAWIFYAWQGIQAEQQGIDLNLVMLSDWFECIPDYYTPILITSEKMIQEQPEVVRSFVGAITRGYEFAIEDPEAAAQILLQSAPELDTNLVTTSQVWISQQYQADASRWGEQRVQVWEQYTAWMAENGIIQEPIDAQAAMTNEFLP